MVPGAISTVAGTGATPTSGVINGNGGLASSAIVGQPYAVAADSSGNYYFVDSQSVLRKVTGSTGDISTLAGTATAGFTGDGGAGTSAEINAARGLCVTSSGDVFIGDSGNNRLRLYYNGGTTASALLTTLGLTPTVGDIYTVAGKSTAGTPTGTNGDGGLATLGNLNSPRGCSLDSTGVYIADTNDNRIRKLTFSTGYLSTVVGNGTTTDADAVSALSTGLNVVADVVLTSGGDLVIAEQFVNKVRVVYEGGSAMSSQLAAEGISSPTVGYVYTIGGTGTAGIAAWPNGDGALGNAAVLNTPRGVAVDAARNIYIADTLDQRIRRIGRNGNISTLAGTGSTGTATGTDGDGGASTLATFDQPYKIAIDQYGNYYIADTLDYRVRFVNVAASTLAFGSEVIGSSSAIQSVLVTNSGSGTLTFSGINVPSGFQLLTGTGLCTSTTSLAAGSSCTVSLQFEPSSAGSFSNHVVITSNATNGSTLSGGVTTNAGTASIAVTGTGVSTGTSTTSLYLSSSSVTVSQSVTITAQVVPQYGTASGNVAFYDGSTLLTTVALNSSGSASYSTAALSSGAHSITASYAGDGGLSSSTSSAISLNVNASGSITIPALPSSMSTYQQVFAQNFTSFTSYSQLPVNSASIPYKSGTDAYGGTNPFSPAVWIAHTPRNTDFSTFISPVDNDDPFGIGSNTYLTLRAAIRGYGDPNNSYGGYSDGILSSMDSSGNGFAQQYGYFEASMWCPGGLNTWPGFYLLDEPALLGQATDEAEIDIVEEYGNYGYPNTPNGAQYSHMTWWDHILSGTGTTTHATLDVLEPGLTQGFHTFGVDVEPTTITWYYDRQQLYQVSTYTAAKRPLYVLLDFALGGGNYNNSTNSGYNWSLTPNPSDLKVQYVSVWASPNSPNYVP